MQVLEDQHAMVTLTLIGCFATPLIPDGLGRGTFSKAILWMDFTTSLRVHDKDLEPPRHRHATYCEHVEPYAMVQQPELPSVPCSEQQAYRVKHRQAARRLSLDTRGRQRHLHQPQSS